MRYAPHASRYSLFALAVSAALLPGAGWAANGDLAGARKPPSVACSWNREAALSYEERRLDTPLPFSGANVVTHDQTPLAERIVKGAGFDGFEPAFAKRLCAADGRTPVSSYAKALKLVTEEGRALWRAAVDRAQGRRAIPAGALPASDDRMLYWTRLYMTRTLRQWAPSFHLGKAQAQALQWRFERASRGQLDIDLPRRYAADGSRYRRMIISGFDVFTLGTPGTANTGLRNGNPSGATALALDGREFRLGWPTAACCVSRPTCCRSATTRSTAACRKTPWAPGSAQARAGSTPPSPSARAAPTSSGWRPGTAASTAPPPATTASSTAPPTALCPTTCFPWAA
ncbi:hypothetical protein [Pseudomonas aeruginosa]|uniref:hypothetical protein n=1 Tax=Pseudomonas aeruginosa TaxID=287 RepID=UPI000A917552|nr:hypothetical protein [Pseudomonas aeruginosa]